MHHYSEGEKYSNYIFTKVQPIKELHCTLIELIHEPTGAEIVYIQNNDVENVFCLSFQTTPSTSNGVAHILEHTVLCGSEKFPVKDPFFSMTRRSLNTYMNALTGQDFTCYPAASQIKTDFYNLLDVYLDAVFHPKLDIYSFYQEGHRLEFQDEEDPESPLEYKGIVYNEMKGAMASASSRNHEAIYSSLFPDVTYGVNSGGDPKEIPKLTYDELIDFYKQYYHPSRCLFYFYGNIPLEEHLDFLSNKILNHYSSLPPLPEIPLQKRFEKPKYLIQYYPATEEEKANNSCYVSFGWLTVNILDQKTILALAILESALMDNDASPIKHAFLKSGLCSQVSSYMDVEIQEVPFVINIRGCKSDSIDQLEAILFETMKNIVKDGLNPQLIDNAMHQLEFHRSEITGDHYPFGLTLFMRSALLKQHHVSSIDGLVIHQLFEDINLKRKNNPHFFEDLIETHFIKNTHFVRLTMLPDSELMAKETQEEVDTLNEIKEKLTENQKKELVTRAIQLKEFQKEQDEEDSDKLPKITLSDVPLHAKTYELKHSKAGNLNIFFHDTFTNSILYTDLTWPLPKIPLENVWLLRLYTVLATQLGSGDRNYLENLQYIEANLGGLHTSLSLHISANDCQSYVPSFHIQAKALYHKTEALFQILKDIALSVDLTNKKRIKEVFFKHYTLLQTTLSQNSIKYAISIASSGTSSPSNISDSWFGLNYYYNIRNYAQKYDEIEDELCQKLQEIQNLLKPTTPNLVISCDREMFSKLKKEQFYGFINLPCKEREKFETNFAVEKINNHARLVSTPVAFIAKSFNTVPYSHPDSPILNIAAQLFDNITLHSELREQGGAYGGGSSLNSLSGNFLFYSYRDPNIYSSFKAFVEAVKTIEDGMFDEDDLTEAKLEILQGMDAPIGPGSRAEAAFCWLMEGKTNELRQRYRNILLNVTKEQVIQAVKTHISPKIEDATSIVFCGKEILEKENQKFLEAGIPPLEGLML